MTKLDLGIMTRIMELWGMKAENQKQDCIKGVTEMEKQDLITEEDDLHHINKKQKMDSEMENQDLITEMEDLHHINNKNKEQMKMNQQEEELQGTSFTYKPMHCLTRSPHLIFGIPCIPPEEEEETSWGIAPHWLI
uniref:Putative ovule protein n=1 Tax=Solanum chacoense TaxID=4108 RepID=A0A0V0H104_SOLCH